VLVFPVKSPRAMPPVVMSKSPMLAPSSAIMTWLRSRQPIGFPRGGSDA
jgi:hypothetical protein